MPKLSGKETIAARNRAAIDSFGRVTSKEAAAIKANREVNRQVGLSRKTSSGGGANWVHAYPKWHDPTEFWDNSGLPWDVQEQEHREKMFKWLRMYYSTHHLVPLLVDIFTRFPLIGIDFTCKDPNLVKFFTEEFLVKLDYEEFLTKLGREFWLTGNAFPLGEFNEITGVWDSETIMPAEQVEITNVPFFGTKQLEIIPPDSLKDLVNSQNPLEQFNILKRQFPDIVKAVARGDNIPVSDKLMRHIAFQVSDSDSWGSPILLRALRTLIHEEKLLSAQDAISDRLLTPFILAKMGAQDIGDGTPWIPDQGQLDALRDDIDIALMSEFRLLVTSVGVDVQNVFGRESMPRLDSDFDRVDSRILQCFGIHPQLLMGGQHNVPYASSALQAEFMNQILKTYQNYLKRHFRARAELVAEAHGFYDYEKKGDTRVPIMEEVLVVDEDGEQRIVKKHKLLIPDMTMSVLDLRDEATQRNFLQQLRGAGVPVSDTTFMVGVEASFEEELERSTEEAIQKTIAQQEGKVKLYKYLRSVNYPVPPVLAQEMAQFLTGEQMQGQEGIGVQVPGATDQFALPGEDAVGLPGMDAIGPTPATPGAAPPAEPFEGGPGTVPDRSNERGPISPLSKVASSDALFEIDKQLANFKPIESPLKFANMDLVEGESGQEFIIRKLMPKHSVTLS